jgi:predicted nucleic acid-binding protein
MTLDSNTSGRNTSMPEVFVDNDVILDLFIRREPHHEEALRFFSRVKKTEVKCFTSPIVIANTYYLLTRLKNKHYAMDKIRSLRSLIAIAAVNEAIIDAAVQSASRDFEDSIQYHCALQNDIPIIITRNIFGYPKDKVTILLPVEFLNL